jgi:hypothetical protein
MILGPDDPITLAVHGDLVRSQEDSLEFGKIRDNYDRVLAGQIRVLGPHHRDTLTTRWYIASWLARAGDPPRAVLRMEQFLVDQIQALGRDHPDVLTTRRALAELRGDVVRGYGKGDVHHWQFVSDAGNLVSNARVIGRRLHPEHQEVQESLERIVEDHARLLGATHPNTVSARETLDRWQAEVNRVEARAIDDLEARLATVTDANSRATFELREGLVQRYAGTGDLARASAMVEQLYEDRVKEAETDDFRLGRIRRDLVWWRATMGNRTAAVNILSRFHPGPDPLMGKTYR